MKKVICFFAIFIALSLIKFVQLKKATQNESEQGNSTAISTEASLRKNSLTKKVKPLTSKTELEKVGEPIDSYSGLSNAYVKKLLGEDYMYYQDETCDAKFFLTVAFYSAINAEQRSKFDLNQDGILNTEEQAKWNQSSIPRYEPRQKREIYASLLRSFDKNGNGQIDKPEQTAAFDIAKEQERYRSLQQTLDLLRRNKH